jgi:hypothetical protein
LVHQVALYRLAVPELWIVVANRHVKDAEIIRYLLPSVGLISIDGIPDRYGRSNPIDRAAMSVDVIAEAERFEPLPEALLQLCWVAELADEARHHRLIQGRANPVHSRLIEMMEKLTPAEQMASVCRQLRARQTLFRADPPILKQPH